MEFYIALWVILGILSVLFALYDSYKDEVIIKVTVNDVAATIMMVAMGPLSVILVIFVVFTEHKDKVLLKIDRRG